MGPKTGKKSNKTPSSGQTSHRAFTKRNAKATLRPTALSGESLAVETLPRVLGLRQRQAVPDRTLWPLPWVKSRVFHERILVARRLPLFQNSLPCERPLFTCAVSSPSATSVPWETPEQPSASFNWLLERLQQRSPHWQERSPQRSSLRSQDRLLENWSQQSPPSSPPCSPPHSPRRSKREQARTSTPPSLQPSPSLSPLPSVQRLRQPSPPRSPQRSPQTSPPQWAQQSPPASPQRSLQHPSGHSGPNTPPNSPLQSPLPSSQLSVQPSLQQLPSYASLPSPPHTPGRSPHTSQAHKPQKSSPLSPQLSAQRSQQLSPELPSQHWTPSSSQQFPQPLSQPSSKHQPSEHSLPLPKRSSASLLQCSLSQLSCQSPSESPLLRTSEKSSNSPQRFAPTLKASAQAPKTRRAWPDQQHLGLSVRVQTIAQSPPRVQRRLKRLGASSKAVIRTHSNSSDRQHMPGHIPKENSSWLSPSGAENLDEMARARRRRRQHASPAGAVKAHAHAQAAKATAHKDSQTAIGKPQKAETKTKAKVQRNAQIKFKTKREKNGPKMNESMSKEMEEETVILNTEMNTNSSDQMNSKEELKIKPHVKTTRATINNKEAKAEAVSKMESAEGVKIHIDRGEDNGEGTTSSAQTRVSIRKANSESQTEGEPEARSPARAERKWRAESKEALQRGAGPRVAVALCDGCESCPLRIAQWHVSGHGQLVLSCSLSQHSQFGISPRQLECFSGLAMRSQMPAPSGTSLTSSTPSSPTLMSSIASNLSPYSTLSHIPVPASLSSPSLPQATQGSAFLPLATIPTAILLPMPIPTLATAAVQSANAPGMAQAPTTPMDRPSAISTATSSANSMPAPTTLNGPPFPQTVSTPMSTAGSKSINTAPLPSSSTPITSSYQVKYAPMTPKSREQDNLLVSKGKRGVSANTSHSIDSKMMLEKELNIGMMRIRQFLSEKKWGAHSHIIDDPRFSPFCQQSCRIRVSHDQKLFDNLNLGEDHISLDRACKQETSNTNEKISNIQHSKEVQTSSSIDLQRNTNSANTQEKQQGRRSNECAKVIPISQTQTTRRTPRKPQNIPVRVHSSGVKRCATAVTIGRQRYNIPPGGGKLCHRKVSKVNKRQLVRSLTGIMKRSHCKLEPCSRPVHKFQPVGTSQRRRHKHPFNDLSVVIVKTPIATSKRRGKRDARSQDESVTNEHSEARTREVPKKRVLITSTATSPIRNLRKTGRAQQPSGESSEDSLVDSSFSSGTSLVQPATDRQSQRKDPSNLTEMKNKSIANNCRKPDQRKINPLQPTDMSKCREQNSRLVAGKEPSPHSRQQMQNLTKTDCRIGQFSPKTGLTLRARDVELEELPRPPPSAAQNGQRPRTVESLQQRVSRPPTATPRRVYTPTRVDSRGLQVLTPEARLQGYSPTSAKRCGVQRSPSADSRRSHRSPSVDSRRLLGSSTRRYAASARPSDVSEESFMEENKRFRTSKDSFPCRDEILPPLSAQIQRRRGTDKRALYRSCENSSHPQPPSPAHRGFAPSLSQYPFLKKMRTALLTPLSCLKPKVSQSSTYSIRPPKKQNLIQHISESET